MTQKIVAITGASNGIGFEARIATLEGGSAALGVGSGSAAITYAIFNIATVGDNIVSASTLYGGTYHLFSGTLPKYGITTKFVNPDDPQNFEKAIDEKTKAIYYETLGDPGNNVIDYDAIGQIAKEHGIPVIVDATFTTPVTFKPFEHGANVIVHSATKFIGGHGTSTVELLLMAEILTGQTVSFPILHKLMKATMVLNLLN